MRAWLFCNFSSILLKVSWYGAIRKWYPYLGGIIWNIHKDLPGCVWPPCRVIISQADRAPRISVVVALTYLNLIGYPLSWSHVGCIMRQNELSEGHAKMTLSRVTDVFRDNFFNISGRSRFYIENRFEFRANSRRVPHVLRNNTETYRDVPINNSQRLLELDISGEIDPRPAGFSHLFQLSSNSIESETSEIGHYNSGGGEYRCPHHESMRGSRKLIAGILGLSAAFFSVFAFYQGIKCSVRLGAEN